MVSKIGIFHKIVNGATPSYATSYLDTNENRVYTTRGSDQNKIRRVKARIEHFKQSFLNGTWYKLNSSLREAKNIKHLKYMFKEFFDLKQGSLFAIHEPVSVKLLSRLRLK